MPVANFRFTRDPRNELRVRGPRVPVVISLHNAFAKAMQDAGKSIPAPVSGFGLIETGCSVTGIEQSVAAQLGLVPIGTAPFRTAGGPTSCPQYAFALTIPYLPPISCAQGVGFDLSGQGILALIGMDVLSHCLLVVNGIDGSFNLSC